MHVDDRYAYTYLYNMRFNYNTFHYSLLNRKVSMPFLLQSNAILWND